MKKTIAPSLLKLIFSLLSLSCKYNDLLLCPFFSKFKPFIMLNMKAPHDTPFKVSIILTL